MQEKTYKYTKEVLGTWVGPNPKSYNPLGKISAGSKLDSSSLIKKSNIYITKLSAKRARK